MPSNIRTITRRAFIATSIGVLALGTLPVSAAESVDKLAELSYRAWDGETELLAEVYAPEGVHTATFYDRTNEYTGPAEIARVAGYGEVEMIGPRIDIPAAEDEWRWASFTGLAGGTACLFHAVDGQIVRHDCFLPEGSTDSRDAVGLAASETSATIDDLAERMADSWGPRATAESLAEVYAPGAVHTARFLDTTRSYTGPEEILAVARSGRIDFIGDRVDFDAPEGELAWASVADVAGGSVCLFRALDGMVTRHDCVLPIR